MDVFIYAADIYCEDCGNAIRKKIAKEGHASIDSDDEHNYDSDKFPKGPYPDGGGECDFPQHCGNGADCINKIKLSDGTCIGVWLENELTIDGVKYVKEAIKEGGEVAKLWAEWYAGEIAN